MRQALIIRSLAVVTLVLFLAGCSEMYAYTPSVGSKPPAPGAEAQPGAAQPAPAAEAPPPKPDLPTQVATLEARVQQLENRLAQMETRSAAPAAPVVKSKEHPATLSPSKAAYPAPAAAAASAADKTYAEGYRLYQAKKFAPARIKFSHYLKEQPKGPRAEEARYYLADSFYAEGKNHEAAVEFNKFSAQHPQSRFAPAALLRQALAYQQQQQIGLYRNTLTKLVKAYPNTKEAREAQKYLKEGKKETPAKAPAKAPAKPAPKPE